MSPPWHRTGVHQSAPKKTPLSSNKSQLSTTNSDFADSPTRDYGFMLGVGAIGLTLDFTLFNVLLAAGISAAWANLVALTMASLVTFNANLRITFRHRTLPNRWLSLLKFATVTVVSVALVQVLVVIAALFTDDTLMLNGVKAAGTAVAVVVRFYLYREWVYREK